MNIHELNEQLKRLLEEEFPPKSFEIEVKVENKEELGDENTIGDLLTDLISDKYGFCTYGFNFEILEKDEENLIAKCKVYDVEWDFEE